MWLDRAVSCVLRSHNMMSSSSFGASSMLTAAVFLCIVNSGALPSGDGLHCPRPCFCNAPSRIVYCSRRGLTSLPPGIPLDSLQLNLNGNVFESPVMRRVNLSSFVHLEHLYLSECRLEVLEVGAFTDLLALRWLDLSNNRLRAILPDTFTGLRLQHLFLNGNRHIQLSAGSFAGLLTVGLYLHDCSLTDITVDLLAPLNASLRYLWLNGNDLTSLDASLSQYFAPLHHLRLGFNPLRCDCAAAWLRSFFERHVNMFRGALPPSCFRPVRLRGRQLSDVNPADLRCRPPSFSALEVRFAASPGLRSLLCAAVGDPTPTVYWIQPSGKTMRYERPTLDSGGVEQVEGVLELTISDKEEGTSNSGLYTCVADNSVGNVTLTVVLPTQRPTEFYVQPDTTATTTATAMTLPVSTPAIIQSILLGDSLMQLQRLGASPPPYSLIAGGRLNDSWSVDVNQQVPVASRGLARFSSSELACAVIVTHISTLLLCVAVVILRRRRLCLAGKASLRRPRRPCDGRRLPCGTPCRDGQTTMSVDRAETASLRRGVRQYTLNDYHHVVCQ